jgi:hypothetical protein
MQAVALLVYFGCANKSPQIPNNMKADTQVKPNFNIRRPGSISIMPTSALLRLLLLFFCLFPIDVSPAH